MKKHIRPDRPTPIGTAIRTAREAKDIGLRQLAALVGLSPTYLSHVERGLCSVPTAERIADIAAALGRDADEWCLLAGRCPPSVLRQLIARPELARRIINGEV
jgi:transcriptional regulator with XRE-family HTH domain